MRTFVVPVVLLSLALPSALEAQVVLRPHDPDAVRPAAIPAPTMIDKEDPTASLLLVPRFEVDTTSANGTTTLFAVRNTTASPLDIDVNYQSRPGAIVRHDDVTLGPRETLTRNVRDVAGLPVDPDGFARGFITVMTDSPVGSFLTGDFLQVDVGNDFATGDRMIRILDLCIDAEIRFLDFGDGTELSLLINVPRGDDPDTDLPSATLRFLDEDGGILPAFDLYTSQVVNILNTADLTALDFGTILFDFSNANGGWVYAEYSAEGKFSVGMNSACLD